jgi:hypothetical protein
MYLLFPTEEDAWSRSEQEGISLGLSFHTEGKGSRYVTSPEQTIDGLWALDVEGYDLDESEQATTTVEVIFPEPTEDI